MDVRTIGRAATMAALGMACSAACGGSKKLPEVVEAPAPEDAAAPEPVDAAPAPRSVWERLGGRDAVAAIVDELLVNAFADNRINKFFEKPKKDEARKKHLRDALVAFVCDKTGGAECGAGALRPLKEAHGAWKLSDAHFDAFLEDFKIALASKNVADDLQAELLAELAKARADVVTPKK